jgi:hypothetical protein
MSDDPYCYPGSNVLRNKFDIRSQEELKVIAVIWRTSRRTGARLRIGRDWRRWGWGEVLPRNAVGPGNPAKSHFLTLEIRRRPESRASGNASHLEPNLIGLR